MQEENELARSADNNHALVLSNGIVLLGGEIRQVNARFVRVKPYDPNKSLDFPTTKKLRALLKHHTILFVPVENDTLDVRGDNILMVEDSA